MIALKGNLSIAKLLVEAGALLDRTTRDGRTALYLAVQEGKTNQIPNNKPLTFFIRSHSAVKIPDRPVPKSHYASHKVR
jgi:ankyrin repeat protein